jgi:hypothetical protein
MFIEGTLIEKLRKLEALHAGTTVDGEREAARRAAERIRERMRHELFQRGIISREIFETEVREKARESQAREGLTEARSNLSSIPMSEAEVGAVAQALEKSAGESCGTQD